MEVMLVEYSYARDDVPYLNVTARQQQDSMTKAMVGSLHTLKQANRTGINEVLK